jgi:hypothetical protein
MAKRNKQLQSDRYSLLDCEIRPVTKKDKWCQRKLPKGKDPIGDAPWGYIVTIPYLPNQNMFLDNVDGYIIRSKKHCGNLLLQVIKKDYAPQYGLKSFTRQEPNVSKKKRRNKKKVYRILNIRNFRKSESEW